MKAMVIGKFQKAHGLKGQLKTEFYTDDLDELNAFSAFYIKDNRSPGGMKEFQFEDIHDQGTRVVCKIDICPDRNTAETFQNVEILVDEDELPQTEDDQFYIRDLMDCQVEYNKEDMGRVFNIIEVADQYVLFIKTPSKKEIALPFEDERLEKVDIENKKIIFKNISDLL